MQEDPQVRKFTKTYQLLHLYGAALVQTLCPKNLKFFEFEENTVQKEMQQLHDMETC